MPKHLQVMGCRVLCEWLEAPYMMKKRFVVLLVAILGFGLGLASRLALAQGPSPPETPKSQPNLPPPPLGPFEDPNAPQRAPGTPVPAPKMPVPDPNKPIRDPHSPGMPTVRAPVPIPATPPPGR